MTLAAFSGLTFSLFIVTWAGEGEQADTLWKRSVEMGTLLLIAAVMIYPVHILVSQLWLNGSLIPFLEIPFFHAVIQGLNSLVGIKFPYFLMNEALSMTENLGRLSSLLIAIGLSFAVPLTIIVEFFVLGGVFMPTQGMAVLLFILGFTAVRSGILEGDTEGRSEQPE